MVKVKWGYHRTPHCHTNTYCLMLNS